MTGAPSSFSSSFCLCFYPNSSQPLEAVFNKNLRDCQAIQNTLFRHLGPASTASSRLSGDFHEKHTIIWQQGKTITKTPRNQTAHAIQEPNGGGHRY